MDALQAAVLRVEAAPPGRVDRGARGRARACYNELLADSDVTTPRRSGRRPPRVSPVRRAHGAPRRAAGPPEVPKGIGAGIHYPIPLHRQPAYARARLRRPLAAGHRAAGGRGPVAADVPGAVRDEQLRIRRPRRAGVSPADASTSRSSAWVLGPEHRCGTSRPWRTRALVTVCDLDAGERPAVRRRFCPDARVVGDYRVLADDPDLDAVVLATPVGRTSELGRTAARGRQARARGEAAGADRGRVRGAGPAGRRCTSGC